MLFNELMLENHTEEDNPFAFKEGNGLVITTNNYKTLCDCTTSLISVGNSLAQLDGIDNLSNKLQEVINEMLDVKCVFEIELDKLKKVRVL